MTQLEPTVVVSDMEMTRGDGPILGQPERALPLSVGVSGLLYTKVPILNARTSSGRVQT